jgi:hypothetical protein
MLVSTQITNKSEVRSHTHTHTHTHIHTHTLITVVVFGLGIYGVKNLGNV